MMRYRFLTFKHSNIRSCLSLSHHISTFASLRQRYSTHVTTTSDGSLSPETVQIPCRSGVINLDVYSPNRDRLIFYLPIGPHLPGSDTKIIEKLAQYSDSTVVKFNYRVLQYPTI